MRFLYFILHLFMKKEEKKKKTLTIMHLKKHFWKFEFFIQRSFYSYKTNY